jgi:uncharacterized protein YbcI
MTSAISTALVRLLAESTGRGPTKAKTTMAGDLVVVVLENNLTKGERYLVDNNRGHEVETMRRAYQDAIADDATTLIEGITGRRVAAFMSANHVDPDLAAEIFMLHPDGDEPPGSDGHAPSSDRDGDGASA